MSITMHYWNLVDTFFFFLVDVLSIDDRTERMLDEEQTKQKESIKKKEGFVRTVGFSTPSMVPPVQSSAEVYSRII
jgi:hypothetical protein